MNNFAAIVRFVSIPEMRYAGDNQTAIANPILELMARYGSCDTFTINSIAWGKVAEQVSAIKEGSIALVAGQLNIFRADRDGYKESIASLKINEIITELPELKPFNQLTVLGNVGQEVDAKWFESGKNNAKFSLAVRRTKDDTDWFAIELWGDAATVASKYVDKGGKVGVTGHLKLETWTDKTTGVARTKPVIVGDRITLAGKNSGGESAQGQGRHTKDRASSSGTSNPATESDFDDMPF